MPFNVGDVVQLKSGGPLMTVTGVGSNITCTWFDGRTPHSDHLSSWFSQAGITRRRFCSSSPL